FAAFAKIRFRFNCSKELVYVVNQFRRESYADCIAHHGEKTFACPRVVKPLDCRSQSVLRDANSNLLHRVLLDGWWFVVNDVCIREQKASLAFFMQIVQPKQNEQHFVIEHDDVRRQQPFTRLLIETSRILSAGLLSTDMRFAANLGPNFWIRFDRKIAERSIPRSERPF